MADADGAIAVARPQAIKLFARDVDMYMIPRHELELLTAGSIRASTHLGFFCGCLGSAIGLIAGLCSASAMSPAGMAIMIALLTVMVVAALFFGITWRIAAREQARMQQDQLDRARLVAQAAIPLGLTGIG